MSGQRPSLLRASSIFVIDACAGARLLRGSQLWKRGAWLTLRWECEQEESTLHSKLRAISNSGTFTLSPVTAAALSGAFLPGLLPQAWAGQSRIRYEFKSSLHLCLLLHGAVYVQR